MSYREFMKQLKSKLKTISKRTWLNIVAVVLILVVLIAAKDQLYVAWKLLGQVNIWILLLLVPLQFASFYSNAEIFFTYLRTRGQLKHTGSFEAASMALELNFVNHIFPSGGVSGISYMVWRLGKLGIGAGQATMAQLMRYVVQGGVFVVLLMIAIFFATLENRASNWVVVTSSIVVTSLVFLVLFGSYLIGSENRMRSFAHWLTKLINTVIKRASFNRYHKTVKSEKMEKFFMEFHEDYMILRRDKRILIKPALWALAFNLLEIAMFVVSFWALGVHVNLAVLLIAYGAATAAGALVLTPGGAGAYEAIMVAILTAGSMGAGAAFAGVVLTRASLMTMSLSTGFFAYNHSTKKYGKLDLAKVKSDGSSASSREDSSNHVDK